MTYYKSNRFVDGKVRQIIVDKNGKIVNKNPSKDELKDLEEEIYKINYKTRVKTYTDEDLLNYLKQFLEENGKIPTARDFDNIPEYPSAITYRIRFGSWIDALKFAGLDVDLMGLQGSSYKARLAEIKVRDHFKQHPIDLAGENRNSPCDGICPNGKTYDVKSSKLYNAGYYLFNIRNIYKEEIEIFYFLAFNKDYSKLEHAWRVPGEIVEKDYFYIGISSRREFNIENMKSYDITNKFKELIL